MSKMICRDIWALHLSLLPTPPSAEPYFHSQGVTDPTTKAEGSQGGVKQSASQEIDDGPALAGATRASRGVKVEDGKPRGDDSEGEGDDEGSDAGSVDSWEESMSYDPTVLSEEDLAWLGNARCLGYNPEAVGVRKYV